MKNAIDNYIGGFPNEIQAKLNEIRSIIKKAAPDAEESMSYGMPAYKIYSKPLVYFAAYKNHIGLYPTPSAIKAFKNDLICYRTSKGAIQFPIDKAIPLNLISKIVEFRVYENRDQLLKKNSEPL
jgi:uncharacterized protein YdhG (YjbR/CyaY superfamily)